VLRELYDSLDRPRALTPDEEPYGEFLLQQGALSLQAATTEPELVFHANPPRHAGVYRMEGWWYDYRPGQTACLRCLFRWWLERHHGAEWWERIRAWPDFRLSWPLQENPRQVQAFPREDCDCLSQGRWPRHWGRWTDPVSGPLTGSVERKRHGLWRVSVHLHEALASGAHPQRRLARRAAVAEACERWAALQDFPEPWVRVRRLHGRGGRTCRSGLVFLGTVPGLEGEQLSHGLACGSSLRSALQAGHWELVERDALRRWWGNWRTGREAPGLQRHGKGLWSLPGGVYLAFVGRQGKGAWGSAAGPGARQRARREARHNYQLLRRSPPAVPERVCSFADHAAWGWHHPLPRWEQLESLPLSPLRGHEQPDSQEVFYYRFECGWAERLGWKVVKVLSPRLRGLSIGGSAPFHPFS
jgi:hypothetical protein